MPILECYENIANSFGQAIDEEDTGVNVELQLIPQQLCASLGFIDNIPLVFNNLCRTNRLNAWSNKEAFDAKNADNAPNLTALCLFWHQLAGTHAFV